MWNQKASHFKPRNIHKKKNERCNALANTPLFAPPTTHDEPLFKRPSHLCPSQHPTTMQQDPTFPSKKYNYPPPPPLTPQNIQ